MTYKTNNRSKIMEYLIANRDKAVSISEIDDFLKAEKYIVNITTIYRYINKLEEDHQVLKYVDMESGKTTYQLKQDESNCDEHLHLKCQKCGKVFHLDCDFMEEIKKHVRKDHGFNMECHNSVIYGVCQNCNRK